MRPLQNILDINQFIKVSEGKEDPRSSLPWYSQCISQVKTWICQDRTTTQETLRDKARSYANNYIVLQPEANYIDKNAVIEEIADEVEKDLHNCNFNPRPIASILAQQERTKVPARPEDRFIKLR